MNEEFTEDQEIVMGLNIEELLRLGLEVTLLSAGRMETMSIAAYNLLPEFNRRTSDSST